MFDFNVIWEFLKIEPGHGAIQSILLFMIWWTSRGIRKDLSDYKASTDTRLDYHEKRLNDYDIRIFKLKDRGRG